MCDKNKTVSICTPTCNRREFIPELIKCVQNQDYPRHLVQWVILDDGKDKIEDIIKKTKETFEDLDILYVKMEEKVPLGEKRNLIHNYASGDILVYMDDDDYYPPSRVSHAVERLEQYPDILCAGCSKVYVYFTDRNETYKFGPYHSYHATANTFAFKRELLKETRYDDDASVSEEGQFLQNYTIPMIQLDTLKTILIISHDHNTYDKRQLIQYAKKSENSMAHFMRCGFSPEFYLK